MSSEKLGGALGDYARMFAPFAAIYLTFQTIVRLTLAARVGAGDFIDTYADAVRPFVVGFWFDLLVLGFALIPGTLIWVVTPAASRGKRAHIIATYTGFLLVIAFMGFVAIAEHLFWTEFSSRFNFIAVDYLVYTREVVSNILQSYPIGKWMMALLASSALLVVVLHKFLRPRTSGVFLKWRAAVGVLVVILIAGMNEISHSSWAEASTNTYANELSENGYYSFVRAFFHNEIDYDRFYVTADQEFVEPNFRALLTSNKSAFDGAAAGDIARDIVYPGAPVLKNVILVTIESMSAEFMAHFGNKQKLTPVLDRLADEGILFTNMLATGTRTVRGLEAVTLSVPPTPGQSIVRRPGNNDLFSIGSVFRDHGYETKFIYGGDGRFDNMNSFFRVNGYQTIDQTQMPASEITFSNAWGVCDEDLFARTLKEADRSYAANTHFFSHVMTVSNHRPFTYPGGTIDPPNAPHGLSSRTIASYIEQTREAGVRYSDYAIGKFIDQARTRPWFKDTIFIFVADHTASSAGKIEIDPKGYLIPAIIYAPGFVKPSQVKTLTSQIDIPPSILGLLNLSYRSRFVGHDQINAPPLQRAFISNFEKVALVRDNRIVVLGPRKDVRQYENERVVDSQNFDRKLTLDAITYYQSASRWKERFGKINSVVARTSITH